MDMDDPWGSPWADEIQLSQPVSTKESHDNAEGPKTPVKASSLALQKQTNSPWDNANDADDDGFGDWAAAPSEAGIGLDGAHHGAHDGWGDLGGDTHLTKQDTNGFSAAWNEIPTVPEKDISKLTPSLLPKPTDIARQPSPDPWAFDSVNYKKPELNKALLEEGGVHKETRNIASGNVEWDPQEETSGSSESWPGPKDILIEQAMAEEERPGHGILDGLDGQQTEITNNESGRVEKDFQEPAKSLDLESEVLPETTDITPKKPTEDKEHEGVRIPNGVEDSQEPAKPLPIPERASTSQEVDHMSSRPSTSPSEQSHHDDIFSESPRTSLEEDPTRPQMPRKVSSKVQELVEHFDTLAKEEAPEIISGRTSAIERGVETPRQSDDEEEEDDTDDFGDFEEGQSDLDESVEASGLVETSTSPATPDSKVPPQVVERDLQHSPETRTPKKEYGPVEFIPDPSLLSELYPDVEDKPATESCFVPDRVPNDSFTSTEQRKTWYRVSRYGPMRKHNMGDDENYTRVNWTQSEVRVETLKVVARWIEEDRISGRVVLGGGSKAGSMFGWNDQKPAPASISAAFASKVKKVKNVPVESAVEVPREWPKGLVRDRSTSKGRSPSKARRRSSVKSVKSPEEAKVERQSPVANFGWNTVPESSQKSHSRASSTKMSSGSISNAIPLANPTSPLQKRSSLSRSSSAASAFQPIEPTRKKSVSIMKVQVPPLQANASVPQAASNAAVARFPEDDDDWGEMISSPATSTPPVLPQQNGLRHKKSQSLGGAFTSPKASHQPTAPVQSVDWGRSHRSTLSFDDILKPETWSPQSARSQENPNLFPTPSNAFSSPVGQTVPAEPLMSGNKDPWASVDFSFFEAASAPPTLKTAPVPLPKAIPTKTVSFASTRVSAPLPGTRQSKEEMEQDRIVQSVVKGLPDLSYMLRR
jgi:hypothetical protein